TYQALEGTGCGNLQASWPQVQRKMQARQHRYRRVPAVATTTQNVIVQAAQHITHVILLDIPRSQSVEARFGDDTATWLNAVQQQFNDIPNIRIMRLGE